MVAALPFDSSFFKEDFTSEQWDRHRRVVEDRRTRVLVLPPLRSASGLPTDTADLERRPDASERQQDLRRRHYEQVGLWIADTANVLLAVLASGERAGSIGGTARIVACRRSARPDPVAMEIISASTVLAPRSELHRAPNGYVWLIDPAAEPLRRTPPVTVLRPAAELTPCKLVYEAPAALEWGGSAEGNHQHEAGSGQHEHLWESERVLRIAEHLTGDAALQEPLSAQQKAPLQAWPAAWNRSEFLDRISNALRKPTNDAAEKYRRRVYWLLGCFVAAVLAFEAFEKIAPDSAFVLAMYLVVLIAAVLIYWDAERRHLQPIAEDRRAIREALRVQAAWWQAGLDDRVDFVHLKGVDQDLARVREAIRNVVAYASLAGGSGRQPPNWKAIFSPENWRPLYNQYPADWIGNQLYYFRERKAQRQFRGEFIERMSWICHRWISQRAALAAIAPRMGQQKL